MKKAFLILYGFIILAVTVGFILFGEHPLVGKGIAHFIDGRE